MAIAKSAFTGRLFEEECLGRCSVGNNGYIPRYQAMDVVRENQPWDPSDPEPSEVNDLHAMIALSLDLEEWASLKFFTAVGTALDYFHGVDAFVEFQGKVVTLDLTTHPAKQEGKADIVVHPNDICEAEGRRFLAWRIARLLTAGSGA